MFVLLNLFWYRLKEIFSAIEIYDNIPAISAPTMTCTCNLNVLSKTNDNNNRWFKRHVVWITNNLHLGVIKFEIGTYCNIKKEYECLSNLIFNYYEIPKVIVSNF